MESSYRVVEFHIQGLTPTIMNNGRLANPTDPFAKAAKAICDSKQKGKTLPDEKMEELLRVQFLGALYVNEKGHPCWPGVNLEAMLLAAAKKSRKGKDCQIGVIADGLFPLIYDGPKTPDDLWADENFRKTVMAKRGGKPVLTCRPIFNAWELKFSVHYLPDILDGETLAKWVAVAGAQIGLSDWRPKFGRFVVL